jgi:hypothetical protein
MGTGKLLSLSNLDGDGGRAQHWCLVEFCPVQGHVAQRFLQVRFQAGKKCITNYSASLRDYIFPSEISTARRGKHLLNP